jgi:hypothetical protein
LGDITSARVIYWKGFLFLALGLLAIVGLAAEFTRLRQYLLLSIAIWAFCRFYYFLFYVVEKYTDPKFRFAGIGSFVRYRIAERKRRRG